MLRGESGNKFKTPLFLLYTNIILKHAFYYRTIFFVAFLDF